MLQPYIQPGKSMCTFCGKKYDRLTEMTRLADSGGWGHVPICNKCARILSILLDPEYQLVRDQLAEAEYKLTKQYAEAYSYAVYDYQGSKWRYWKVKIDKKGYLQIVN